ncbi:YLR374C-like protein [Saccharomyces kudriavzevii IFO 1802]|uniref:YLR374C-like protein n=1 Tax=Saccharomyces kudriavzevii (strain ATCC MYA-4449 / AS 2.2408 / CBS 8840 / NBRC 1802 / NCYC 2889) TaxID=226230 RepID=J5PV28_SACK1|nr:YLR374C-like protein [Saccharomyces kudriavzevii IFO 1802]
MFILGRAGCVEADDASPLYCLSAALIRLSNDEMGGNVTWFIVLLFALLIARCTCHTKETHPDSSKSRPYL